MRTLYEFKPHFVRAMLPVATRLTRAGVTPNAVTALALLGSVAVGGLIVIAPAEGAPLVFLAVWLAARMTLNALDGLMARMGDGKTRLGAFLNELGDVASDAALYLPLALVPGVAPVPVVLLVVVAGLTEVAGILAQALGDRRRYEGPLGKSDRALAVGVVAFLLGIGLPPGIWLGFVLWALVVAASLTVLNRVRAALAR